MERADMMNKVQESLKPKQSLVDRHMIVCSFDRADSKFEVASK